MSAYISEDTARKIARDEFVRRICDGEGELVGVEVLSQWETIEGDAVVASVTVEVQCKSVVIATEYGRRGAMKRMVSRISGPSGYRWRLREKSGDVMLEKDSEWRLTQAAALDSLKAELSSDEWQYCPDYEKRWM